MPEETASPVSLSALDRFCREGLSACGADGPTVDAATRAMLHATRLGIDTHGVRLLPHYVKVLLGGRLNRTPHLCRAAGFGAVETLDADDAHGALAAYTGMARAQALASQFGIGAVGIRNSSHFGPAGAYSCQAAREGYIGVTFCNTDSFVRLHDGGQRFHGTNPLAVAAPLAGEDPWLFDMATSTITYNRVMLSRSLGQDLPPGVASDMYGVDTHLPERAEMLAPLGGEFGFKGAGLAGMVEIFSAVLTGMKLSVDIAPMGDPEIGTPRGMGAFVMAIRPDAFTDAVSFQAGMRRYVDMLRDSPSRDGATVMAPGDREWRMARLRDREGVVLDPATREELGRLAQIYGLTVPWG